MNLILTTKVMGLILRSILAVTAFVFCIPESFSQQKAAISHYDEIRYITEKIEGVYIPKDMDDAMAVLDRMLSQRQKDSIKNLESALDLHFGLGMWMRNNWNLWGGSRLTRSLDEAGYVNWDADGISSDICFAYMSHLKGEKRYTPEAIPENGKPARNHSVKIDEWEWKKIEKNRKALLEGGYKEGTIMLFTYPYGDISAMEKDGTTVLHAENHICEGVITDINYWNSSIKIRLTKTHSPHGIIIYDGNLKRGEDGKYKQNGKHTEPPADNPAIFFMKTGEEIWFPSNTGHWKIKK